MRAGTLAALFFSTFVAGLFPSSAKAADDGGTPDTMFPKGTWMLQFHPAYYSSVRAGDEQIVSGTAAVGYYFDDRHSIRAELVGYGFDNKGSDDAIGVGTNLGLRFQFLEYQRLTLFIEGLVGLQQADHVFPRGGTNFNFNEQVGLGATFRLTRDAHLIAGARYMHISNARIRGDDENPSFDGVGGYVGVLFTF